MEDTESKPKFEEKLVEVAELQQKMHRWNLVLNVCGITMQLLTFIMLIIIYIK